MLINSEFGAQHQPLTHLDVDNFVLDEMHLLLRIKDVLERNLIDEASVRDARLKTVKQQQRRFAEIAQCFRDCRVSFAVRENKDTKLLKWKA